MNTDTPETDKLEFEVINDYEHGIKVVSSKVSRKLERDLAETRAELAGIEDKMRVELRGHPDSELWGGAGLIAATMRCVDALGVVTDQLAEAREKLSAWRILNGWGGTPEIIHDFIQGQQTRIHYAQKIEDELTAVTAQRDRLAEACDQYSEDEILCKLQEITAQRDEARGQRDDFKKELEIANLRLKGKRHPDDNGIMADGEADVKALTEQRDRLAKALWRRLWKD
jgi:hypothetical protein